MLWVIAGVAGWIAMFFLKEERSLWKSFIGGIIAVMLQLLFDVSAVKLGLYKFYNSPIDLYDNIGVFYTFGVVFSMGTIFTHHLPRGRWLKIAHIAVFSILFYLLEGVLEGQGYFKTIHWGDAESILINFLSLSTLAFFAQEFNLRGRVSRW